MRTFVRVVESGSFSGVAHEMHATQSGISKQVASLEKVLGAKLLVRTTRSLALTEEGGRYFEQARRLLAEIEEAESGLRSEVAQLRGSLRVAASVGYGRLKLMPLVKTFMWAHPDVKMDLRLHDGFIDLIEQGIDVAVRIGELADSGLLARRIGTSQRMLMAHKTYVEGLPPDLEPPANPHDLDKHNCLVYSESLSRNLWSFQRVTRAGSQPGVVAAVRVQGHLETNSSEVIRAGVMGGMGICYSPTWLFEQELATGEVVQLMRDWVSPELPIHVVSPPGRQHSAKVRAFVEHVERHMGSQPE